MAFIRKLVALFYSVLFFAIGVVLVIAASALVPAEDWAGMISNISRSAAYQIALMSFGGIMMITAVILPFRVSKNTRLRRQITFQNPDGEVTISIAAIEEYIYRAAKEISGISNVRSRVSFGRKGINIVSEVTINAGSNIPKLTEEIQSEIKNKVKTMLGVEEQITMVMRVNKITGRLPFSAGEAEEGAGSPHEVPFR
ncbi:MAG: alkaline shock response membrane anchor protein AmaP [Candidatus Omnitrophica bacterium]|nr:alkaline shock response membrane anchor protein AmaP [Candidatus Omnitrophota bacterium]MBU1128770.1 alkaline shock response membrane anchor protein AmaP [Candidatus Omnitrophota bacterium]MBU1656543.1 alkaline shock response membrane anchor protein AmaP [Candidatus Omnitrophota bacterium]MBU1785229.1 alkaline shock response membrane anchor protein AmaP [Candidatus Omnitrophota bacterium]MBU1851237.1 alkaline shock response membrane anchor protein AmaP [Candidatus Omnitrophota bacterium]